METVNGVQDTGPPPPSPLTGCYLLIVVGEPHSQEHKNIILQRIAKGLLSWDVNDCLIDLEKELSIITEQAPEGEEARYGERLIQYASENLVTEVLIHPAVSTLAQCVRNLLSSFTRHRHIIHAGYTFAANGSWILQDGTFSLIDFSEAFQEIDVQRVVRAYENSITVDIHCSPEGDWSRLPKEPFAKHCKVRLNPVDVLNSGSSSITNFLNYISPFLVPAELESLLECSDVVGNIRFSHPTLYIFPGGQGDAALFGINGFNMLLDGGFSRKACFWDFVRHLDRLDAVLLTRLNNGNTSGLSGVLRRKMQNALYPQIGHFFCNIQERKSLLSPDGDKDKDPLLINLLDEGENIITNLKKLNLTPQICYRDSEPINLYHKVGHGTLDMYVLSPAKDSKEVREFLYKWNNNDQKLFGSTQKTKDFQFPLQNLVSICCLLVWQPANPNDNITRILYPGSTPQHKIFEGLDKLRNLEYIKHPMCSESKLVSSSSITGLKSKQIKDSSLERLIQSDQKSQKLERLKERPPKSSEIKPKVENKDVDKVEVNGISLEEPNKFVRKSDSTESEKSQKVDKKKPDDKKPKPKDEKPKPKPKVEAKVEKKKPFQHEKKASPTTPKKAIEKFNGETKETPKIKLSPSATPAKSAKEATNRKVIESKNKQVKKELPKQPEKPKETKEPKPERKPISRRTKTTSPSAKAVGSPIKKANGTQKPDSIIKKAKLDKEATTDSSTVSTPSADQKDITKLTAEEIEQLKAQELADLKEDQEVVKEIEAVFRKGESGKDNDTELRKIKDISIEDKTEPEEYLIIEKEEVEIDSLDDKTKEDEIQKHTRDSEESEKMRKSSDELKISVKDKEEIPKIESRVVKDESKKDETPKEISATSTEERIDISSEKKLPEGDLQEQNVALESQPDEKFSTTVESGATTAPTLPEDERIPLDEIKEDDQVIEEKHVKEHTKEKEVPVIQLPPESAEGSPKLPHVAAIKLDKQTAIRDIVKTPDEVADLPVHEEADIDQYPVDVMKTSLKAEDLKIDSKPTEKVTDKVEKIEDKEVTTNEIQDKPKGAKDKDDDEHSKHQVKEDIEGESKGDDVKKDKIEPKIEKIETKESKIETREDTVVTQHDKIETQVHQVQQGDQIEMKDDTIETRDDENKTPKDEIETSENKIETKIDHITVTEDIVKEKAVEAKEKDDKVSEKHEQGDESANKPDGEEKKAEGVETKHGEANKSKEQAPIELESKQTEIEIKEPSATKIQLKDVEVEPTEKKEEVKDTTDQLKDVKLEIKDEDVQLKLNERKVSVPDIKEDNRKSSTVEMPTTKNSALPIEECLPKSSQDELELSNEAKELKDKDDGDVKVLTVSKQEIKMDTVTIIDEKEVGDEKAQDVKDERKESIVEEPTIVLETKQEMIVREEGLHGLQEEILQQDERKSSISTKEERLSPEPAKEEFKSEPRKGSIISKEDTRSPIPTKENTLEDTTISDSRKASTSIKRDEILSSPTHQDGSTPPTDQDRKPPTPIQDKHPSPTPLSEYKRTPTPTKESEVCSSPTTQGERSHSPTVQIKQPSAYAKDEQLSPTHLKEEERQEFTVCEDETITPASTKEEQQLPSLPNQVTDTHPSSKLSEPVVEKKEDGSHHREDLEHPKEEIQSKEEQVEDPKYEEKSQKEEEKPQKEEVKREDLKTSTVSPKALSPDFSKEKKEIEQSKKNLNLKKSVIVDFIEEKPNEVMANVQDKDKVEVSESLKDEMIPAKDKERQDDEKKEEKVVSKIEETVDFKGIKVELKDEKQVDVKKEEKIESKKEEAVELKDVNLGVEDEKKIDVKEEEIVESKKEETKELKSVTTELNEEKIEIRDGAIKTVRGDNLKKDEVPELTQNVVETTTADEEKMLNKLKEDVIEVDEKERDDTTHAMLTEKNVEEEAKIAGSVEPSTKEALEKYERHADKEGIAKKGGEDVKETAKSRGEKVEAEEEKIHTQTEFAANEDSTSIKEPISEAKIADEILVRGNEKEEKEEKKDVEKDVEEYAREEAKDVILDTTVELAMKVSGVKDLQNAEKSSIKQLPHEEIPTGSGVKRVSIEMEQSSQDLKMETMKETKIEKSKEFEENAKQEQLFEEQSTSILRRDEDHKESKEQFDEKADIQKEDVEKLEERRLSAFEKDDVKKRSSDVGIAESKVSDKDSPLQNGSISDVSIEDNKLLEELTKEKHAKDEKETKVIEEKESDDLRDQKSDIKESLVIKEREESRSASLTESPEMSSEHTVQTFKEAEIIDKMEIGRKSPKEREEDVAKIVASVAEVLKSDAPLEEFEGKIPINIAPLPQYTGSYTTELRETHITTLDSPITDHPKSTIDSNIIKENDGERRDSKASDLIKESKELMQATSKMISDIKQIKPEEKVDENDLGTVHRMLVTASSEDGGEEIEICPKGSITFSKSSESSGRSTPEIIGQTLKAQDPDSKLSSGKSTPDIKITPDFEKADIEDNEKVFKDGLLDDDENEIDNERVVDMKGDLKEKEIKEQLQEFEKSKESLSSQEVCSEKTSICQIVGQPEEKLNFSKTQSEEKQPEQEKEGSLPGKISPDIQKSRLSEISPSSDSGITESKQEVAKSGKSSPDIKEVSGKSTPDLKSSLAEPERKDASDSGTSTPENKEEKKMDALEEPHRKTASDSGRSTPDTKSIDDMKMSGKSSPELKEIAIKEENTKIEPNLSSDSSREEKQDSDESTKSSSPEMKKEILRELRSSITEVSETLTSLSDFKDVLSDKEKSKEESSIERVSDQLSSSEQKSKLSGKSTPDITQSMLSGKSSPDLKIEDISKSSTPDLKETSKEPSGPSLKEEITAIEEKNGKKDQSRKDSLFSKIDDDEIPPSYDSCQTERLEDKGEEKIEKTDEVLEAKTSDGDKVDEKHKSIDETQEKIHISKIAELNKEFQIDGPSTKGLDDLVSSRKESLLKEEKIELIKDKEDNFVQQEVTTAEKKSEQIPAKTDDQSEIKQSDLKLSENQKIEETFKDLGVTTQSPIPPNDEDRNSKGASPIPSKEVTNGTPKSQSPIPPKDTTSITDLSKVEEKIKEEQLSVSKDEHHIIDLLQKDDAKGVSFDNKPQDETIVTLALPAKDEKLEKDKTLISEKEGEIADITHQLQVDNLYDKQEQTGEDKIEETREKVEGVEKKLEDKKTVSSPTRLTDEDRTQKSAMKEEPRSPEFSSKVDTKSDELNQSDDKKAQKLEQKKLDDLKLDGATVATKEGKVDKKNSEEQVIQPTVPEKEDSGTSKSPSSFPEKTSGDQTEPTEEQHAPTQTKQNLDKSTSISSKTEENFISGIEKSKSPSPVLRDHQDTVSISKDFEKSKSPSPTPHSEESKDLGTQVEGKSAIPPQDLHKDVTQDQDELFGKGTSKTPSPIREVEKLSKETINDLSAHEDEKSSSQSCECQKGDTKEQTESIGKCASPLPLEKLAKEDIKDLAKRVDEKSRSPSPTPCSDKLSNEESKDLDVHVEEKSAIPSHDLYKDDVQDQVVGKRKSETPSPIREVEKLCKETTNNLGAVPEDEKPSSHSSELQKDNVKEQSENIGKCSSPLPVEKLISPSPTRKDEGRFEISIEEDTTSKKKESQVDGRKDSLIKSEKVDLSVDRDDELVKEEKQLEQASAKSSVIVESTGMEEVKKEEFKTEVLGTEKTGLEKSSKIGKENIKETVKDFLEAEKTVPSSSGASIEEAQSLSGKSTPDIADVERYKEIQETLTYEKHIPGHSTPPTVPVSPIVKDVLGETKPTTITTIKEQELRSSTSGSDDFEQSDFSSSQMSRAPNLVESDARESDDEDILGSPTSVTSQIGHSPQHDFDEKVQRADQMSLSFYGCLPGDSGFTSGKFLDDSDVDFEKAMLEHRQTRGEDLTCETAIYLHEVTQARYAKPDGKGKMAGEGLMTSSFIGTELPTHHEEKEEKKEDKKEEKKEKQDPIESWGKPLGLPTPAPPSDNKGTPKKERKLASNVSAKNKLNDDRKRSESPSKYDKKKKMNPIYVDLTYVPHHGNSNYSFVDFFKRIRARYYVFSGIEPSKEVYNALLEAKQTWEDKELEVTIIPTYDTDVLGYWVAENEELLTKYKIDLSPSASRCTINLQDHETSCSAYRLEF